MQFILAVDDETNILELLRFNLTKEGYKFAGFTSSREALRFIEDEKPDLVILDLMLPEMDGYDILRTLKANPKTAFIPVILLSAKGEVLDKVLGLELGAEDYITKPFSPREVVARVKAQLRRKTPPLAESQVEVGKEVSINHMVIRPEKYEVVLKGTKLELTLKEFELLHLLAVNPGRVFTRDVLLERIWGYENVRETRTVDVHIRYLRQKIGKVSNVQECIETVRGVGYRFREIS